jgi:S1-C subfamily serine protease
VKVRIFILLFILILSGCATVDSKHNNFLKISQQLDAATVLVASATLELGPGGAQLKNPVARGSGFFINSDGLLLTARHVIMEKPLKGNEVVVILKRIGPNFSYAYSKNIVHDFPDVDIMAIQFAPNGQWLPLSSNSAQQGSDIAVFGYPAAELRFTPQGQLISDLAFPREAKTTISSIQRRRMAFDDSGVPISILSNFIEAEFVFVKGNSGGPIVSVDDGTVVGVVTGCQNIPQDLQRVVTNDGPRAFTELNVKVNGKDSKITEFPLYFVPYATYCFGVSIDEITSRLRSNEYSTH